MRHILFWALSFLFAATGVSGQEPKGRAATPKPAASGYLYVWAGHDARTESDALLVVDIAAGSPTYSKVVHTVPVGSAGNEPHHIGLSSDGATVVAGGLLTRRAFFFHFQSDPARPK